MKKYTTQATHETAASMAENMLNGNRSDVRAQLAECKHPATLVLMVVRHLVHLGEGPLDAVINVQSLIDAMDPKP